MTHIRFPRPALPLLLVGASLLTGCAHDTLQYPSLAVRPVEKQGFAEPEVKPVVAQPDPALDRDVAALSDRLNAVAQEFTKAHGQAQASARRAQGQAVGSDAWLTAQTDLAGLDEIRARSSALLTDIDDRALARAAELKPDYPALNALRDRAAALIARQGQQIGALSASLPAA
ncbi:hypothetical protein RN629_08965 [Sphingomonadaceae bacterium jetA1]|jgi:hypothetical protein|uniref:hypothetical protein n=1 Tax=Facivitalis istanbulensis TaxID=3075838 RepID=UPI00346AFF3B